MRHSIRVATPRAAGTRTSGLRFFSDQAIAVGASYPGPVRALVEVVALEEYKPTFDEVFIKLMGDTGDINDYD